MAATRTRFFVFWLLLIVTAFQALTAVVEGVVMVVSNGGGVPATELSTTPFATFLWPGLILAFVVGGTQAVAAVLLVARHETALVWSAVAGFGMVIWIFVQTFMITGTSWLQAFYFGAGVLQLALVFGLAGIVGWLPREPLRSDTVRHLVGAG